MNRNLFTIAAALVMAGAMFTSCAKDVEENQDLTKGTIDETRAYGDKTPIVMAYYEINDTNPLNALSYTMANGEVFLDIVQLFASNIHKDSNGDPNIYFNDKLAPVMADVAKYVRPIQAAGIKVLLTVLGDWQGIGVANMTQAQADKFAAILTYIVDTYGLDGIGFDDEYANYPSLNSGSYARVIKAVRAKLDAKFPNEHKLITVFQWGNYGQIDAAAGAMIDYADQGSFGANIFPTSSSISGMTNDRWMPQAINMGSTYNTINLNYIKNRSGQAKSGNYGGIMMFNIRKHSDRSPLPVYQKIAEGAFSSTVTYTGTEYSQDWTFNPNGHTISYADVPAGF
ncbi:glycosyl hydrolase family 18 protein [uncultured Alistipes sp.]|jgi:glycosyl hydrolases family 18|uniref:glycosyl hydrolase family 18 protein n=1 Tax=uncultured Alistipes sp. TaxID=538949 RepID=UPI0025FA4B1E|nr:glycosyl hydrolase family 18 protein [uncultured Alistipes sp.]